MRLRAEGPAPPSPTALANHHPAVHTRELIAYRSYGIGTLASTYPASIPDPDLAGLPIPLQEYYAQFPDDSGDILLLAMPISRVFSNALPPNPPNLTLTVSDLYGLGDGNLAAGRQRVALFGSLERVKKEEVESCRKAYLEGEPARNTCEPKEMELTLLVRSAHSDARGWVGAGGPHFSFYARLRVNRVFAFESPLSRRREPSLTSFPRRTDSAMSPTQVLLCSFLHILLTYLLSSQIGWLPLDLYRESGKLMRSRKEVLKHWREPVQPEELGLAEELFAETVEEEEQGRERLRIQW